MFARSRQACQMLRTMAFAQAVPLSQRRPRHSPCARRRPPATFALATPPSTRVRFPALRADRFRHPIDVQATRALRSLFGLEAVLRRVMRAVEQTMLLENLATGVKVSEKQLPDLHRSLTDACAVLDMDVPDLYVRQNATPNAYTLAVQGKRAFIVVHSALVELLTESELQAVLAHELGHLKCEHGVWFSMANVVLLVSGQLLGDTAGRAVLEGLNAQLLRWQRAAEFSCDRAALLVMQDPRVVMSALMKLCGGSPKYAAQMDVDAFLEQADAFDEASSTRFGRIIKEAMTSTHPLPVLRVRELKRWAESNHFQSIVRSGRPLGGLGAAVAGVESKVR